MTITSTDHYAIVINKCHNFEGKSSFMKYVVHTYGEDPKQKALKLHKQLAHPSKTYTLKLIKDAGIKDEMLQNKIEKLEDTCETCIKRTSWRSVVKCPHGNAL